MTRGVEGPCVTGARVSGQATAFGRIEAHGRCRVPSGLQSARWRRVGRRRVMSRSAWLRALDLGLQKVTRSEWCASGGLLRMAAVRCAEVGGGFRPVADISTSEQEAAKQTVRPLSSVFRPPQVEREVAIVGVPSHVQHCTHVAAAFLDQQQQIVKRQVTSNRCDQPRCCLNRSTLGRIAVANCPLEPLGQPIGTCRWIRASTSRIFEPRMRLIRRLDIGP